MFSLPWRTRFEPGALVLERYPFPRGGASARLEREALAQVCVAWFPPTLRTREGEFLFVPATQARELADFAAREGLPFVRRVDLWSLLLEEFLDTEFSPEVREATLRMLEDNGVSRAEAHAVRQLVERRMLALTSVTWEWCHYGLYDVLGAMRPLTFTTGRSFGRFYQEAMRLAERGKVEPSTHEEFLRPFKPPGG